MAAASMPAVASSRGYRQLIMRVCNCVTNTQGGKYSRNLSSTYNWYLQINECIKSYTPL